MKGLNEKILKWAHLSFYQKRFSRYLHLKFKKEVIFLGRFSPYEILAPYLILGFQNCLLNSYLAISLEPLDRKS